MGDDILGRALQGAIHLRSDLAADRLRRVYGHEIGHVIDDIAGLVRTQGVSDELRDVYNALNNPNRRLGGLGAHPVVKPVTPEDFGYEPQDVSHEYWAEAIRAYLFDPNYIKTVAPNTAAAIRAAVNAHPRFKKTIQFNSALAPVAAAGLLRPADGEGSHHEDERKKASGNARIDPSDPRAGDKLPIKEWMKLRNQQKR
jgi:hypothetical protein